MSSEASSGRDLNCINTCQIFWQRHTKTFLLVTNQESVMLEKLLAPIDTTINTNYCLPRKLHSNTNTFGPQNPLDHPFEEKRYGHHKKYRHIFDKASVLPFHTSHILLSQLLTVPHLDSYDMLVTH